MGDTILDTQKDGTQVTQITGPISLPSGAATAANQNTEIASLASIDSKLTAPISVIGPLTDGQLRAATVTVSVLNTPSVSQAGTWNINNITGSVSLPIGAATSALQSTGNSSLASIDTKLTSPLSVTGPLTDTQLRASTVTVAVSNIPAVTQSGTWNLNNITGVVSLPTGAATAALQTQPGVDIGDVTINNAAGIAAVNIQDGGNIITVDGTVAATQSGAWSVRAQDGSGNLLTSTVVSGAAVSKQPLDVSIVATAINYYSAPVAIDQTAATAANATVWSMRNPSASTRTVYIERIYLNTTYDDATPVTRQTVRYNLCRFSTATPTAGTVITAIKMDNANPLTQVTDIRFLDTGLTTTGVVFESAFATLSQPATGGIGGTNFVLDKTSLKLAAGEGLCIRLATAALNGIGLCGQIVWSER